MKTQNIFIIEIKVEHCVSDNKKKNKIDMKILWMFTESPPASSQSSVSSTSTIMQAPISIKSTMSSPVTEDANNINAEDKLNPVQGQLELMQDSQTDDDKFEQNGTREMCRIVIKFTRKIQKMLLAKQKKNFLFPFT